jgi:hypothetical protein
MFINKWLESSVLFYHRAVLGLNHPPFPLVFISGLQIGVFVKCFNVKDQERH